MNLKQCDLHFIDLNLKAIPLHLERVSPMRNSSIKLVNGLAHTRFNYLSPSRTGNLIIICCFLYGVEGGMNRNCSRRSESKKQLFVN